MKPGTRKRPANPSWESKEDTKRRNWKEQEVMAMLNLIKKHNLLEHIPSDAQLGETLLKPMINLGYVRTAHQIKIKIKSLRKSYIQCKNGNLESLKICSFYDLLDSLYSHVETKESESEEEVNEVEEDLIMWTESEVNRLLMIVKQLDLNREISMGNVSQKCLRQIHRYLQNFNISRNLDQIKTLLLSLRNTYANYKREMANGSSVKEFPYFEQLDSLWRREYANGHFYNADGYEEYWSEEETIILLETLKEMKIDHIDDDNKEHVSANIEDILSNSGYKRTKYQIIKRIENLKQNYAMAKKCENLDEAIMKFPFYQRFENVFNVSDNRSRERFLDKNDENNDDLEFEDLIKLDKKKVTRGYIWVEEEVTTLLDLVKSLDMVTIFRGRMTQEYVSQLVIPMMERGYKRTATQIKIKLKCLRNQYYRCVNGTSKEAKEDIPFFDKIHEMVQMLETRQDKSLPRWKIKPTHRPTKNKKKDGVLKEIEVDNDDVSYSNNLETLSNSDKTEETILWEPVESIPDEAEYEEISRQVIETEEDHLSDMFEEVSEDEVDHAYIIHDSEDTKVIEISEDTEETENEDHVDYAEESFPDEQIQTIEIDALSTNEITKLESIQEDPVAIPEKEVINNIMYDHIYEKMDEKIIADEPENCMDHIYEKMDEKIVAEEPENCMDHIHIYEKMDEKIIDEEPEDPLENTKSKSTDDILQEVLKHEEMLQQQHQLWLEKQFEIQRKHETEQRAELLNELRELRNVITSTTFIGKADK